eukprot:5703201-Amphidinium_carterae.1
MCRWRLIRRSGMWRHRCTAPMWCSHRQVDSNILVMSPSPTALLALTHCTTWPERSAPKEVPTGCPKLALACQVGPLLWHWCPTALAPSALLQSCSGNYSASCKSYADKLTNAQGRSVGSIRPHVVRVAAPVAAHRRCQFPAAHIAPNL